MLVATTMTSRAVPATASSMPGYVVVRFHSVPGVAARLPAAYPQVIRPTCATIRLNDVKPTIRCWRASRSWPKARSSHGSRAISRTWASSRSAATRPVSRPVEVSPEVHDPRSWMPRSATHQ